jgi:hypothetical protein
VTTLSTKIQLRSARGEIGKGSISSATEDGRIGINQEFKQRDFGPVGYCGINQLLMKVFEILKKDSM